MKDGKIELADEELARVNSVAEKYKEFIIDGELSSDFSGILNFFYSFDNMEKKVKIDSCKIKKSEKGVTADVELSTYMLNEVIKSGKE